MNITIILLFWSPEYQEKEPLHVVASLEYRCGDIEGSLPPSSTSKQSS
jgi:hypothetical protein